ncbi:MAG: MBOAT family protein, partial [bacterium]
MLFPSSIFVFIFAPITFIGYWLIRNDKLRRLWLTCASYIFYGYWDWRFTSLMLIASAVNFVGGLMIRRSDSVSRKRLWLVLALVGSLG